MNWQRPEPIPGGPTLRRAQLSEDEFNKLYGRRLGDGRRGMTDSEVLLKVYQLWGSLRIRNPASPEDLAARDVIRVELETRFGELPKRPLLSPATMTPPVPTFTPEGQYAIFWNPRLVHGNALKKHAHAHEVPHGEQPGSRGYFTHLHGNNSHAH